MAIFHLHVQIIKRSSGRSSVAASAYRAGEKLHNENDGITHDYTRKSGVVHAEIMLPENAPQKYNNRSILWNAVEKIEKRKDAQTAREIDIALPVEFDRQEQIALVQEYIKENFVDKGMCADFAVHNKGDGNPHAHIMLTTREVSASGFGGKNRDWNDKSNIEGWRENWADICNKKLQTKGISERIDHRTLKAQGIDREPTIHIGATAKAMEQAGHDSDRIREYREIISQNKTALTPEPTAEYMHELKQGYIILDKEITGIKQQATVTQREIKALQFRIEEITERTDYIKNMRKQLNGAKNKQLVQTYEQARNYFKREYHITPEESTAEIKRLEYKIKDFERASERLQDRFAPLTAERDSFMLEYQRYKALIEFRPNNREIQDYLEKLDKNTLQKLSVREKNAYIRSMRTLDTINERNFQEILKNLHFEQGQELVRLRERERERDRLRTFQRGR